MANFWNLMWKSGDLDLFFLSKSAEFGPFFPWKMLFMGLGLSTFLHPQTPPPQKNQCLGRAGLTSCPQKIMGGPEKAPPPTNKLNYIYKGQKKAMTAISPLRGSFVTQYFSQPPFFLEIKNKLISFFLYNRNPPPVFFWVRLYFFLIIYFWRVFCQMNFLFKMAKDKCFWGFFTRLTLKKKFIK